MNDPKIPEENQSVDFYSPEGGPGQDAAGFSATDQQKEFLGGSSEPQKESEQQVGVHKSIEINGKRWGYFETGTPDAEFSILNISGFGGGSGEGNERLSQALAGHIEMSRGMQTLRQDLPKGAEKIEEIVKGLKGKYHTITPQIPGGGFSEALDNPTLDNLADELAEFIKATGLKKPILFGSSMGGILAVKLAARHPEMASALALQGVMTQPDDMRKQDYILAQIITSTPIRQIIEKTPGAFWVIKKLSKLGNRGQVDFKLADEQGRTQMLRDNEKAEAHTSLLALRGIGKDLEAEINQIKAPVVLLDGENAVVVSIDKTKRIAGRFHPEIRDEDPRENLRKKISERQVLFYKIGGVTGEHAHSVINTFPEGMAVMINHAVNYFKINNKAGVAKA